ncbi:MAG: beta-lactamase family protein [Acidobacteria bacterium]|nr:beta-lactamase family protein [Acidobacteriota bacterium]
MKCWSFIIALLCVCQCVWAQQPDFSELEKVIVAELQETNAPGASLVIVRGSQVIYAKGFGTANVETNAPVTPDMLFRLGSTTKMFTAAALVQLAEQGKLRLDEPIGKYAKGLSGKIAALTANQLLSHLSGLKDTATMFGKHDDEALGETVRALRDDFFFAEPDKVYSYSNPNFWLAGYLIEAVSGKAYADQLNESLFKPLGMQRTTFRPTLALTYPLAQGHEDGKIIRPAADNAGNWPAGSMFSSALDLSRWVIAFLNGGQLEGKQVLAPSLIATMMTPRANLPGSQNKYGYGLTLATQRGVKLVEHGGSRSGYGSFIRMAPAQRIGIILTINKSGGSLNKTLEKASELMLPFAAKAETKPQPITMTEVEMRNCIGVFGDGSTTIEIALQDGKLIAKTGTRQSPVQKIGQMRFAGLGNEFVLIADANGKAEFLHAGGRTLRRQAK